MQRIGASDEELQLRTLLVFCAIGEGRLADAADELGRMDQIGERDGVRRGLLPAGGPRPNWRSPPVTRSGLEMYRECAVRMREIRLPGVTRTGMEPWVLFGEAMALSALARYAAGDDVGARGARCSASAVTGALRVMSPENPHLDYPAVGAGAVRPRGVGSLLRGAAPASDARMRCGCSPWPTGSPITTWSPRCDGSGSRPQPRKQRLACSPGSQARVPGPPAAGLAEQARLAVERLPG